MSSVVSTGNCKLGHDCRRVCSHRRRDATRQFRLVGVDGVHWALYILGTRVRPSPSLLCISSGPSLNSVCITSEYRRRLASASDHQHREHNVTLGRLAATSWGHTRYATKERYSVVEFSSSRFLLTPLAKFAPL